VITTKKDKYWLTNKCVDCGKSIDRNALRCGKCAQSGKRNPSYGKKGEQAFRFIDGRTNKKAFCIDCGNEILSHAPCLHKRCWTCRNKYVGNLMRGEKNRNWRGGRYQTLRGYNQDFNKELKLKIKKRDNHTCQECGIKENQSVRKLDIHHIDYNKRNNKFNNLITLCRSCHTQSNYIREDWTKYFQNKLGLRCQ